MNKTVNRTNNVNEHHEPKYSQPLLMKLNR